MTIQKRNRVRRRLAERCAEIVASDALMIHVLYAHPEGWHPCCDLAYADEHREAFEAYSKLGLPGLRYELGRLALT